MLFDKNGFYMLAPSENYDFGIDFLPYANEKTNTYNPTEALRRGNLFPKLYKPYKNYEPGEVKVYTEREKCLLEIQKLDFVINDLNLYLDINPDDKAMYKKFMECVEECRKKKDEYKRIYGPLVLDDLTNEYEWSTGVWPWERKGM